MTDSCLFLTGPMKGIPNSNRSAYDEAFSTLIKDARLTPIEEYFTNAQKRLSLVLECDGVVLLPAWAKDEQAKAEVLMAVILGKPLFAYHQHRPEKIERLSNVNIVTRAEILANG